MSAAFDVLVQTIVDGASVPAEIKNNEAKLPSKKHRIADKKAPAANKVARAKPVAKKEITVVVTDPVDNSTENVVAVTPATQPATQSKAELAREIVKRLNGVRKDCIAAIMNECNMSTAGAATYFYNAKKALSSAA